MKDPDSARALEAEMQEAVDYLDVNAALAMADMLLVRLSRTSGNDNLCFCIS